MTDKVKNKGVGNSNKSVNWIIEYFEFVRLGQNLNLCTVNIGVNEQDNNPLGG